jgi:hypothetical protein
MLVNFNSAPWVFCLHASLVYSSMKQDTTLQASSYSSVTITQAVKPEAMQSVRATTAPSAHECKAFILNTSALPAERCRCTRTMYSVRGQHPFLNQRTSLHHSYTESKMSSLLHACELRSLTGGLQVLSTRIARIFINETQYITLRTSQLSTVSSIVEQTHAARETPYPRSWTVGLVNGL